MENKSLIINLRARVDSLNQITFQPKQWFDDMGDPPRICFVIEFLTNENLVE